MSRRPSNPILMGVVPLGCKGAYLVPLTRGKYAIIDREDWPRVGRFNWFANNSGYAARTDRGSGHRGMALMHREILDCGSYSLSNEVDHANHDRLDNRKRNLRVCTRIDNSRNKKRRESTTYIGVFPERGGTSFKAAVSGGSKTKWLGNFATPLEAAKVRDAEAYRMYGEFAVLNFPDNKPTVGKA